MQRLHLILLALVAACSSDPPKMDASVIDASAPDAMEAATNCVPKGGSCKTDAGTYLVNLCCSGMCALGSVNTGTCE